MPQLHGGVPGVGGFRLAFLVVAAALLVSTGSAAVAGAHRAIRSVPLTDTQSDILQSLGAAPAAKPPARAEPASQPATRTPTNVAAAPTQAARVASTGNATSTSGTDGVKLDRSSQDLLKALTGGGPVVPQKAAAPTQAAPAKPAAPTPVVESSVDAPEGIAPRAPRTRKPRVVSSVDTPEVITAKAPAPSVDKENDSAQGVVANASTSTVTNSSSVQAVVTEEKSQHKVEVAASKLEDAANEAARKLQLSKSRDAEEEERAKQQAEVREAQRQALAEDAERKAQAAEEEAKQKATKDAAEAKRQEELKKAEEAAASQKELEVEAARKAAEQEAAKAVAAAKRQKELKEAEEATARQKELEVEASRKAAEEEAARKKAAEETAIKVAEEAAQQAKAEAELRKKAEALRLKEAADKEAAEAAKRAKVKEAQESLKRMAEQARAEAATQNGQAEDLAGEPERPEVLQARRKARQIAEKRATSEKTERLQDYFANKAERLRGEERKENLKAARWEAQKSAEEAQARQEAEEEAKRKADILQKHAEEAAAKQKRLRNATSDQKMMEEAQAHAAKESHRRKEQDTVVNFLFLVNDALPHSDVWNSFLAEAAPHQAQSFVHCRDRHGCRDSGLLDKIPRMQLVETVPTYYCHDLVTAMVELLRSSLKTTTSKRAKFVFISDSTLPLKPFSEVYSGLDATDDSDICVLPSHHWGTMDMHSSANAKTSYLVKHSQWVVLNKEHAEKMVREWKPVDQAGHWQVPIAKRDANHLVPASTDVTSFVRKSYANYCTDEWAFFATIFGAIPDIDESKGETSVAIPGWGGHNLLMRGPAIHKVQGQCRTFAYWDDWGEDFNFLAKTLASDYPRTELSCYPNCGLHPMTMNKISDAALLAMRKSPFMFGRKFALPSGQSVANSFNTIVLAKVPPSSIPTPDVRNLNAAGSLRNDITSHDFLTDRNPPVKPPPKRRPSMDDVNQEPKKEKKAPSNGKTWWSWMWGF